MNKISKTIALSAICASATTGLGQGPSIDYGWQVKLLQIGESFKYHQYASIGSNPLVNWSSVASDWLWGTASFGTSLFDGLNPEDNYDQNFELGITHRGGVKPIFRWVPGANNIPAPAYLYVKHTAAATIDSLSGEPNGSINNGLSSPIQASGTRRYQGGNRVFKVEGTGEIEMPIHMLFADVWVSSLVGTPSGEVNFRTTVLPYPYVSGNDFAHEDSGNFRKGPHGEALRNFWNAAKLIEVDSVVNWSDQQNYASGPGWYASPILKAHQQIYDSNQMTWRFSGDGTCSMYGIYFSDNSDYAEISPLMYYGNQKGQSLGKSTIFKVTITDRDDPNNIALEIPYKVNWHLPYENWFKFQPDMQRWYPTQTRNPQPSTEGCGPGDSYQWDSFDVAAGLINFADWTADWSGVAADFVDIPILAGMISLVGMVASDFVDESIMGHSAAFDIHWGRDTSKYYPFFDSTQKLLYKMTAAYMVGKTDHFLQADEYTAHGYSGQIQNVVKRRDGRTDVWATFVLDGGETPPQIGG